MYGYIVGLQDFLGYSLQDMRREGCREGVPTNVVWKKCLEFIGLAKLDEGQEDRKEGDRQYGLNVPHQR